jgi:predicted amidohydrolase YtcJ
VTHEYTILTGATILPGGGREPCEAIAWAQATVLALGSEAEVRAISRGDSHLLAYPGAFVVPLGEGLEVGAPADLASLDRDPRSGAGEGTGAPIAFYRGGHLEPRGRAR